MAIASSRRRIGWWSHSVGLRSIGFTQNVQDCQHSASRFTQCWRGIRRLSASRTFCFWCVLWAVSEIYISCESILLPHDCEGVYSLTIYVNTRFSLFLFFLLFFFLKVYFLFLKGSFEWFHYHQTCWLRCYFMTVYVFVIGSYARCYSFVSNCEPDQIWFANC